MSHDTLPTIAELDQMDDLSGSALYSAEVKRIPFIPREEQAVYVEAARMGDETAQQRLLMNCLNWTMTKAASVYRDREPAHSDLIDLVSHAHLKMLEALPKAVHADDPMRYLMSVSALEMRLYCTYEDPLVKRPRWRLKDNNHPTTVSLEAGTNPPVETIAVTDERERIDALEYQLVQDALADLAERRRQVLTAAYGLFDHPAMHIAEIALMLNVPKKVVENDLYRGKRALAAKLGPYAAELGLRAG